MRGHAEASPRPIGVAGVPRQHAITIDADEEDDSLDSGAHPHLILASASPRRREILSGAWRGRLTALVPGVAEGGPRGNEPAGRYAVRMAEAKCLSVAAAAGRPVIAADTVVEMDGEVFEKPRGDDEALRMLTALRAREHTVTTGLAVAWPGMAGPAVGSETTTVRMRRYSGREIADYVASGEPFDKAGGYAVQDRRLAPAERVIGCYLNVVGLPLCRLAELLDRAGPGLGDLLDTGGCSDCPAVEKTREGALAT